MWFAGGVGLALAALPTLALADSPTAADVAAAADGYDIVILGEVHDHPAHHAMQADVARRLAPTAFVFEMLDVSEAALITPEAVDDLDRLAADLEWDASGWPDFAFYASLFEQAAVTAIYGAELDRESAQAAFGSSAAEVFNGDAARFGLSEPLPQAEQAAREAAQLAAHCDMLPADILPGFVEAQRLRDAELSRQALRALDETGGPVVVITGNGHARQDWGMPSLLAIAAPDVGVFALGQMEGDLPDSGPFDLMTTADPIARPDPCAAFR